MMIYKVKKASGAVEINGQWQQGRWEKADVLEIKNYMGEKPVHFPQTSAKLLYDDDNIYVFFQVIDKYVRCRAGQTNGPVWLDSCVEFFFTPEADVTDRYFNLEANCGGTILLRYNDVKKEQQEFASGTDCRQIEIFHNMPDLIESEIEGPLTWFLQYKLPIKLISKYYDTANKPDSAVRWRANFYKCADNSSHPHWLSWTYVDNPEPNFHLPEFFGVLEFE